MQFLQLKTQEILQRLNSVNKNKFNENEYIGFIKNCKIYDELRDDNLKEIFKVLQKMSDDKKSITRQQFISILKKLNNSIIFNIVSIAQLNEDQVTLVIENLKIIHGDFSLKREVSNYQKNDFFNFILNNNFESKVLTIKVLDTYPQNNMSLLNLKDFYEKLEKQIIYDQTQQDESQLTQMNQSQLYQSQLSEQDMSIGFLDKVKQNLEQIMKLANFQDIKLAQASKYRDTLIQIIPEKFNYLKKQLENEQEKFNDSEMKLVQKEQKIKTLCNHLDSREIELNNQENEIRTLKQDKMVLQNQLRGKGTYCDQQEDQYNKDLQKLVDQLESANLQIKEKNSQIKMLENQYDEVRRMYETNQKSLEEVRKKSNQVDQATFDLIKYKNESESLQNQLQLYKQRQDNMEQDYQKLLEQKNQQDNNYQEECQTLRDKILNLEKEKIELERQVNDNINMSIMGSLRDSVRDSNIVFDNYDSIIDVKRRLAGKDDIQDLDMTNQLDLTNDFNPILENPSQQNTDDQKMSLVQNNFKEFSEQKKLELMKKDEELQQEREKNNKLEKQIDSLEQQIENNSRQNTKLKQSIVELESQNKIFQKDKDNLMKDIEELAKEKDKLKQNLKQIQDQQQTNNSDKINKQNDELLQKLQAIKQKDDEIQQNKSQIQKLDNQIKSLNLQIVPLKEQLKIKDTQINKLNTQLQSSNQQQKSSIDKTNKLEQQLIKENQKNLDLINRLQLYKDDLLKQQEKIKKMNKEIQDLRDENRRKSVSLLDSFQFDQSNNNSQFGKESILIKDPKLSSLNDIQFDDPPSLQTQQNNIFNKKKKPMVNLEKSQTFQKNESVLIQNIISKNKNEENDKIKKDNKIKTYSYDHIEVARKTGILKIITQYQSCKTHSTWFSDLVTRVNSRNHHTSKILVVTEIALFIFSNQKQLKKKIELLDIQKIIHNKSSNYICICQAKERDVLQVLRKDELLLFIRRKLKSLKSKLRLVERHQLVKQDYFHNLQAMNPDQKKFGKEFNNTIQIASRLEKIVMVKIDKEGVLFDSTKEILALLTDFGIICLSKGSKKVIDFMPLGEAQLIKSKKANVIIIEVMKDKKRYLTFISQKERDLWFNKIENCQVNLMKLNEQA